MIITDRPRSDVVMDLDSKVNKSTLKLTINSDLSHKWLYAWLRHKHMQYELGRISIAICVSGRRLSTRRCISTIEPKRASSGTWSPMTMRSFTPTAKLASVDDVQKSRLNTYEHALSACRICATIEDEPVETLSLAQTWHGCILDLVCYNSTTNYCRKGHATGFIRMPRLQRLKVKLAECSGGVITNESPCDAYSSELTFPVNANA